MNQKWVSRTFEFDFPASEYIHFLNFLKQTPDILQALINTIADELLTKKIDNDWSIQENAGHLLTVDSLFVGRLDDYVQNKKELRAADMSGGRTDRADYNSKNIGDILQKFRVIRQEYISRLEKLDPEYFAKTALHPRLNKPMRLCDMLYFQQEHDKHHLKKIEELKIKWMP